MKPEPLRVVEFTNTTVRAGVEEHILSLLCRLDRGRFRPYLVCPDMLAGKLAPDLPPDVELFPLDFFEPYQVTRAWRFGRWLRQKRIQIVHAHMFYSSLCASPVARLAGVRAIVETPHVSEGWRHGWKANFVGDRLAARAVDAFIAVSEANARYLIEQKRLPPEKVHVIRNGIEPTRFESNGQGQLRSRLGIAASDPIVVCIARLEPQKGHHVLLEAIAHLRRRNPSVWLVLVGEGSLRNVLDKLALSLGIQDRVRFVGWQSSIAEWLALADVVALASFYEGLPLVALEALAARRPVVATAVDGTPEVVRDGQTGLTVAPGDPHALARAMQQLLEDKSLARRLANDGRELIESSFSHSMQVTQTEQLYLEMWRRRHRHQAEIVTRKTSEVTSP